ncbi:MAG: phosphatase PAP2 family protein [candidate division Zixibacteria bacterium]|nr:phosphatase PAP2 family protein [candidate division Zixibacteria bacterium]
MSRVKIVILSVFLLVCLIFVSGSVLAAGSNNDNILDRAVKQFYYDGKNLFLTPFHWDKKERLEFLAIASITAGLFLADEELQKVARRNRSNFSDDLARLVTPSEHIYPQVVIGSFYLGGLIFNRKKEKDTAWYLLEAVMFTQGITQVIKYSVGRARPFADKGAYHFEGFRAHPSSYSLSFPSGHASTAFSLASVIAEQYDNKLIDWASYSLAFFAAWARVNDNVHFTSDVFFGGVLGTWVGKTIVRLNKNKKEKSKELSVHPKIGLNSIGVSLNF